MLAGNRRPKRGLDVYLHVLRDHVSGPEIELELRLQPRLNVETLRVLPACDRETSYVLFFIGNEDKNDSVVNWDSFSSSDEALVMRRFGKTPVVRLRPRRVWQFRLSAL